MSAGMRRWVDQLRIRGREGADAVAPLGEAVRGLRQLVVQGEALPRAAASLERASDRLETLGQDLGAVVERMAGDLVAVMRDNLLELRGDLKMAVEQSAAATRQTIEPIVEAGIDRSVAIAGDRIEALADTLRGHVDARSTADAAWLTQLDGRLEALFTRLGDEQRSTSERIEGGVRERTAALLEGLESTARSLALTTEAQQAAIALAVESAEARVARLEVETGQRLHALFDALKDGATRQSESVAHFEATLAERHGAQAEALRVAFERQSGELGSQLVGAGEQLRDVAAVVAASGAEMSALTEAFSQAVERHREASMSWLERLGDVEGAVDRAGRGAAADALASQLASTEEVLARQLDFHREMFAQLRALRGDDPSGDDLFEANTDAVVSEALEDLDDEAALEEVAAPGVDEADDEVAGG
jgi:hypothetical protein